MEKGRERSEKSIVLIKDGIYQGYCYAPYQYYTENIEQLNDILLFKKRRSGCQVNCKFLSPK